jgi:hypothetical protein
MWEKRRVPLRVAPSIMHRRGVNPDQSRIIFHSFIEGLPEPCTSAFRQICRKILGFFLGFPGFFKKRKTSETMRTMIVFFPRFCKIDYMFRSSEVFGFLDLAGVLMFFGIKKCQKT